MEKKLSIKDLDLKGKKVLIRVDFNVPMEEDKITDDTRMRAALPTIRYALDQGAAVILMSHLGRPEGTPDPRYSLAPCGQRLSELLSKPILMARDCMGPEVQKMASQLKAGEVLLLENLRFHKGEEKPREEPGFASALAQLGNVYVDDAFGCAHRSHASITTIAQFFPGKAAAGFLLEKEIEFLGRTLTNPQRPFIAILGGAKVSTKFKIIEALMRKADVLLIGGAMANTFFKAEGYEIGDSLYEKDFIPVAKDILDVGNQSRCRIVLPVDVSAAKKVDSNSEKKVFSISQGVPGGFQALDIGPETVLKYAKELEKAATVFWNGPLGVFEHPPFDKGTKDIALILAQLPCKTIVGGGDSVAAIEEAGVADRMTHLSTGGGAALEFLEMGTLPGIEALSNAQNSKLNVNK